jgi:hypothetical protein
MMLKARLAALRSQGTKFCCNGSSSQHVLDKLVVLQVPVEPSHASISVPKRGFHDKPAMCHISVCTAPTGRVWRRPDTKREAKAASNGMAAVDMKRCSRAVSVTVNV